MHTPWKRVFVLSSVITLSGAGIWLVYIYKTSNTQITYNTPSDSQKSLVLIGNTLSEIDSDSDGLKDWEEHLWGTDRNKTDSDSDGTPDGLEVKLARNPMIKGPNDSLADFPLGSATTTATFTSSDILSQELFARYAQAKSRNGTLSPADQQQIIEEIIKRAESIIEKPKEYGFGSLQILQNPNITQIQAYYSNINNILLKGRPQNVGNELALLGVAVETRDDTSLSEVKRIAVFYEDTAKKLLSVSVPASIAEDHLFIINTYLRMAKNVLAFAYALSDPFVASTNLSDYIKNSDQFTKNFLNIKQYLETNGIQL